MAKTITLRVADETYDRLVAAAKTERRSLYQQSGLFHQVS